MLRPFPRLAAALLALGPAVTLAGRAPLAGAPVSVAAPAQPAAGRRTTVVRIGEPGRYALRARSDRGVSLRVYDKAAGPSRAAGRPGGADGRHDRFLDAGEVLLESRGAADDPGQVTFEALPFRERNARPPRLVPDRWVTGELRDLERASYRLELDRRQEVILEAAGRALAELRLWRDGGWMVPAEPAAETREPAPGKPLGIRRLVTTLDPGVYRLTAYGGPPRDWSAAAGESPLHVRWGVPARAAAARSRHTVGPTGRDVWRVPGAARHFRLELPRPGEAGLAVGRGRGGVLNPYGVTRRAISRAAVVPVAAAVVSPMDAPHLVEVTGRPGQPYVLQHFPAPGVISVPTDGDYLLATIHGGDPRDAIDAGAILVRHAYGRRGRDRRPATVVDARVVTLDPAHAWARRFDLPGPAEVLLHTETPGRYRAHLSNPGARFTVEPFFHDRPPGSRAPETRRSGEDFALAPGYHRLRVTPSEARGVTELLIRPAGHADLAWSPRRGGAGGVFELDAERETVVAFEVPARGRYRVDLTGGAAAVQVAPLGRDSQTPFGPAGRPLDLEPGPHVLTIRPAAPAFLRLALRREDGPEVWDPRDAKPWRYHLPVRPAVAMRVRLDRRRRYTLHTAAQPGVPVGVQLRRLPLDLKEPLFVGLRAGEDLRVPVRLTDPGVPEAVAADGTRLGLEVDGRPYEAGTPLRPGTYRLTLLAPAEGIAEATLGLRPADPADPLPASDGPGPAPRRLPELTAGAVIPVHLPAGRPKTFRVRLPAAGLWSAETRGLLATRGTLRTRMNPALAAADSGGTGRNFRIARRLAAGEYRLDLAATGRSAGDAAVRVAPRKTRDLGVLPAGRASRSRLAAGEAGAYSFEVAEAGGVHLAVVGLGWDPPWTLEDEHGWPQLAPGQTGSPVVELPAGRYRLVLEPAATPLRRVVRWERPQAAPRPAGKGPHPVAVSQPISAEYRAPGPDVYRLRLPARATVTARLGAPGLRARWVAAAGGPADALAAGGVELAAGEHRLEVAPAGRDDRVPYSLTLATREVLPGVPRALSGGSEEFTAAIGEAGRYRVETEGGADTRMELRDGGGTLLAAADDRPTDWNPAVTLALAPGRYPLRVTGGDAGSTLRVTRLAEVVHESPGPGGETALEDPDATHVVPLRVEGGLVELTLAGRDSPEVLRLRVEESRDGGWHEVARGAGSPAVLRVPVAGRRLRARAEADEGRVRDLTLRVTGAALAAAREDGGSVAFDGATAVALARPGVFEVRRDAGELEVSHGGAFRPVSPGDRIAAPARRVFVRGGAGRLTRFALAPGERARIRVPAEGATWVDLGGDAGGARVVWAESAGGTPGVRLAAGDDRGAVGPDAGFGFAPGRAVATLASREPAAARVWLAAGPAGDAEVEVRAAALPRAGGREAEAAGVSWGILGGGRSRRVRLPDAESRVRVTLDPGMLARLDGPAGPRVVWAADAAETFAWLGRGGALDILQPGPGAGRYSLEVLAAPAGSRRRLSGDGAAVLPLEEHAVVSRTRVVAVPPGRRAGGAALVAEAPAARAAYLDAGGRLSWGTRFPGPSGGMLVVAHDPGVLRVYPADALGPGDYPVGFADLRASGRAALAGPLTHVALREAGPALVRVRTDSPVVADVRRDGTSSSGSAVLAPADRGLDWVGLAGVGRLSLMLRPLHDRALGGAIEAVYAPPLPLGDGVGPEVLTPAGGLRAFSFEVPSERPVGIGLRSVPSGATMRLLDATGAAVGAGPEQLVTLAAGTYYLAIEVPSTGPPRRIRPALTGLKLPGKGPPPEVLATYEPEPAAGRGGRR